MSGRALIVGAAESPYSRHPPAGTTTESLLADAFCRVLQACDLDVTAVDGLGVASFTLAPDHVIDLAWRLGVRPTWLMEDTHGGASGINLLQHAIRAVEAGDANTIVLLAGDHLDRDSFRRLVEGYNRVTASQLSAIPTGGPNALFALLTQSHMQKHGLMRADYGQIAVTQRRWAARNPGAVYREPLTLSQYLSAPVVAEPLRRFDCVPVVSGANALLISRGGKGVGVRSLKALHNVDGQTGDGLITGLADVHDALWADAGIGAQDVDFVSVYDDYPVMVLVQLADLGFAPDGDIHRLLHRIEQGQLVLNTSGGQLSAGQAGAAGGMHGLVESVLQLLERAGERQVEPARLAVATGYGMVLYRYGACANAVVLERV